MQVERATHRIPALSVEADPRKPGRVLANIVVRSGEEGPTRHSEKPDVLNPGFVPESQYQKERSGEVGTRPLGVRHYAFSEDMQWYGQECPMVQLWGAGEVEQRSCRKVVHAFMVRGVGDLRGVIEKLIRMDKSADVAHQLTSTYRFDEPTASWAQRCIQIAHEFYTLMVQVPPSGTP
jgi:hypothetical protein